MLGHTCDILYAFTHAQTLYLVYEDFYLSIGYTFYRFIFFKAVGFSKDSDTSPPQYKGTILNMQPLFYKLLIFISKRCGLWIFILISRIIAGGYYLLFPTRVLTGIRFYRVVFPDRHIGYHMWCVWKQFCNFTSVFMDRFLLQGIKDISYTMDGWDELISSLQKKRGAIILMSHFGNWEVAAHLFRSCLKDFPFLLYMGRRSKDGIENIQKQDLAYQGIKIISTDENKSSPLDILEAIRFLKSGGIVSLSGDKIWRKDQRTIEVSFMGHRARLPETPHLIALLSGSPIFVFFPFSTGQQQYHFMLSGPFYVTASSRSDRSRAIMASVHNYITILEKSVLMSPFEWYHFEPFLIDSVS